ncbi:Gene Transfer Agent associated protein Pden_3078 [hydrothermal vent metagenome]|uniref:Gene Transfer Agent associated protein Pden_3078 n=1 Tax=hydrothermal vent metagenome TaxID=652676 RepID=A0A3B0S585_9ZZZZ
MSETTNLALPFIEASQAQKHVTHNEALLVLDALVQTGIVDRDLTSPPASPVDGEAFIPASGSTAQWYGNDLAIAVWQDGAWKFHTPQKGWIVYLTDENMFAFWNGNTWSDLSSAMGALQNISSLGINTAADATNKLSVSTDAVLFNHDGNGVQHKLNKNAANDTASLLFQTNFSGRAEMGITGDDDFHFKVSPDGATWNESIRIDRNNGGITFPKGALLERHLSASVDLGGGADWWGPADHLTTAYTSGSGVALANSRMYFSAFFVPRTLLLLGGFVSLHGASSTTGALLRVGIYELGAPNGSNWDIGNLVADFGTLSAETADNKVFDLANPVIVEPGWYLTAVGVSGSGADAIYGRWHAPGLTRYYPHGSGASGRPRILGPSYYIFENGCTSEIVSGLPATWTKNPALATSSINNFSFQLVFPKWREV